MQLIIVIVYEKVWQNKGVQWDERLNSNLIYQNKIFLKKFLVITQLKKSTVFCERN